MQVYMYQYREKIIGCKLQVKYERRQSRDKHLRVKLSVAPDCTGLATIVSPLVPGQLGCRWFGSTIDGFMVCCTVLCVFAAVCAVCARKSEYICRVEIDPFFQVPGCPYKKAISHKCGMPLPAANIAAAVA